MAKNACAICGDTEHMDAEWAWNKFCRMLGHRICAWCQNGIETTMKLRVGLRGGGRGKNGTLGRRVLPSMTETETLLWALDYVARCLSIFAWRLERNGTMEYRSPKARMA